MKKIIGKENWFALYISVQLLLAFCVRMQLTKIMPVCPKRFIATALSSFVTNKTENFRRVYPKDKSEKNGLSYWKIMSIFVWDLYRNLNRRFGE